MLLFVSFSVPVMFPLPRLDLLLIIATVWLLLLLPDKSDDGDEDENESCEQLLSTGLSMDRGC